MYVCVCFMCGGTIWGLSCANLGSKLCAGNLWNGQVLTHALHVLPVWHVYANWMMAHREDLEQQMKISFLSTKRLEQIVNTRVGLYQLLIAFGYVTLSSIEWADIQAMHRNAILWLCSAVFNRIDSALPCFIQRFGCNPRIAQHGQSKDLLFIPTLHPSLGAIRGLLHKARIWGLRRTVLGLSWSTLCA